MSSSASQTPRDTGQLRQGTALSTMAGLLLLRSPPHNTAMGQEQAGLRRPSRAAAVEAEGRCLGPGEGCPAVMPAGHGVGACGKRHKEVLGVTKHSGRKEQITGSAVRDSSISHALGGQRFERWANGTERWRGVMGTRGLVLALETPDTLYLIASLCPAFFQLQLVWVCSAIPACVCTSMCV